MLNHIPDFQKQTNKHLKQIISSQLGAKQQATLVSPQSETNIHRVNTLGWTASESRMAAKANGHNFTKK